MKTPRDKRFRAPSPGPRGYGVAAMAAPRRTVLHLTALEVTRWHASYQTDDGCATEECDLIATLSDGREVQGVAQMVYEKDEREKLVDAVMHNRSGEREVAMARSVLDRQRSAIERARADMTRLFGPVVASPCVAREVWDLSVPWRYRRRGRKAAA
jgi:hypothetical protein